MGRPKGSKDKKPQHKWTDEEKEYLASIVKGSTYKEITKQMNDKFEYEFSEFVWNRFKLLSNKFLSFLLLTRIFPSTLSHKVLFSFKK